MQENNMPNDLSKVTQSAGRIAGRCSARPTVGLFPGTGLSASAEAIANPIVLDYADIPYFPQATIPTHAALIGGILKEMPLS